MGWAAATSARTSAIRRSRCEPLPVRVSRDGTIDRAKAAVHRPVRKGNRAPCQGDALGATSTRPEVSGPAPCALLVSLSPLGLLLAHVTLPFPCAAGGFATRAIDAAGSFVLRFGVLPSEAVCGLPAGISGGPLGMFLELGILSIPCASLRPSHGWPGRRRL